jgi:hypothetical protein
VTQRSQEAENEGYCVYDFKNLCSLSFQSEIWDSNALMEMKQTLGGLVSGVLQELNVKFLFVPESPGNSVQQICSAPYVRPVSGLVPRV